MPLPRFPFIVLDTETTGLTPRVDKVLELALVRYEGGEKVAEWESLFDVGGEIPPFVQVLTRIRPEDLRGKPAFDPATVGSLVRGAVLVGHNIPFDLSMLKGEGLDLEGRPWVDTAMLASLVFPECPSWSLGYLSAVLTLPHEPRHRAMGDVRAATALLGKIWERLSTLPEEQLKAVREIAERGPEGYAALFSQTVCRGARHSGRPAAGISSANDSVCSACPGRPAGLRASRCGRQVGAPLQTFKNFLDPSIRTWLAVKNLRATLRSLDPKTLEDVSVIHSPQFLPDPDSADAFLRQPALTPHELTLALKLLFFKPKTQFDLPIHGDERDVWKGKLACTRDSEAYKRQFGRLTNRVLIDHRQLLELLQRGGGPRDGDRIIIDDASMLEDTATKAFRFRCSIDPLRAAAEGDAALTSFLDACQLWIEKVRGFRDIRYLMQADLKTPDARGLRERLESVVTGGISEQVRERLEDLRRILNPDNVEGRITFIEQFRDGGQIVQSVPFDVAHLLRDVLYDRFRTTLLLPPGDGFEAIIPKSAGVEIATGDMDKVPVLYAVPELTLDHLLRCVDGRVICLVGSRRLIEQLFVRHTVTLEEAGVSLVAQSGGLGRMQAEFLAGGDRAIWFLTPWLYESVELPPGSVNHLWIHTLPFDHPSHAILSRRAERYRDGFNDYYVPRLLHRLFRILRTFNGHRREDGDVLLLDQRVKTREYGKRVVEYLGRASSSHSGNL